LEPGQKKGKGTVFRKGAGPARLPKKPDSSLRQDENLEMKYGKVLGTQEKSPPEQKKKAFRNWGQVVRTKKKPFSRKRRGEKPTRDCASRGKGNFVTKRMQRPKTRCPIPRGKARGDLWKKRKGVREKTEDSQKQRTGKGKNKKKTTINC